MNQLAARADRSDTLDHVARAGLVAYGVVHLVIGVLAVRTAFGERSGSASSSGALKEVASAPFGQALVWALAVGLFLLAAWQATEAVLDQDDEEGAKRVGKTVIHAGKAIVYVIIGISAVRVATGSGSSGGGTDSTTAQLMDLPGGQLIVVAVGLVIGGIGCYFFYAAFTDKFMKHVDGQGSTGDAGTTYRWLGRVGHAAKGVAFFIIAGLFIYAGVTHESKKSGGLDVALRKVLEQPFGPVLLTAMGLGFAAYGLFCFARARHLDR